MAHLQKELDFANGPAGDMGKTAITRQHLLILYPTGHDRGIRKPQGPAHMAEKGDPLESGLHQSHLESRINRLTDKTGKPGTGTDIQEVGSLPTKEGKEGERIKEVLFQDFLIRCPLGNEVDLSTPVLQLAKVGTKAFLCCSIRTRQAQGLTARSQASYKIKALCHLLSHLSFRRSVTEAA